MNGRCDHSAKLPEFLGRKPVFTEGVGGQAGLKNGLQRGKVVPILRVPRYNAPSLKGLIREAEIPSFHVLWSGLTVLGRDVSHFDSRSDDFIC